MADGWFSLCSPSQRLAVIRLKTALSQEKPGEKLSFGPLLGGEDRTGAFLLRIVPQLVEAFLKDGKAGLERLGHESQLKKKRG